MIALIFSVLSYFQGSTQAEVNLFLSVIHVFNTVVMTIMIFTRAKPYASVVVTFLWNIEQVMITNLALRDMLPSFLTVDLDNLKYFDQSI
jgi:hypothetical protein